MSAASLFNIKFVPFGVRGVSGRQRVKSCHIVDARRMLVMMPSDQRIKVRFLKGGRMYAGLAQRGKSPEMRFAKTARPVNFGAPAPAHRVEVAMQNPRAMSVKELLGNLTAIEAGNRIAALQAARASR